MSENLRWEYKIFESKDAELSGLNRRAKRTRLQAYLNGLGAEGWEIVNVDFHDLNLGMSFVGVAKRRLETAPADTEQENSP